MHCSNKINDPAIIHLVRFITKGEFSSGNMASKKKVEQRRKVCQTRARIRQSTAA
jgi:hypothetical protein